MMTLDSYCQPGLPPRTLDSYTQLPVQQQEITGFIIRRVSGIIIWLVSEDFHERGTFIVNFEKWIQGSVQVVPGAGDFHWGKETDSAKPLKQKEA